MRLLVTYEKRANRQVWFKITVTDRGDFPTAGIFVDDIDPDPEGSLSDFSPEAPGISYLEGFQYGAAETKRLVRAHIAAVKKMLDRYRGLLVPADEEFEI